MEDRPGPAPAPISAVEARLVEDGRPVRIVIDDGAVIAIERGSSPPANNLWVSPGWMDIQVNGFGGHDPNRDGAGPGDVVEMVRGLWRSGVTAVCPTICTQSPERMLASLRAVAEACRIDPLVASSIAGVHVEGPHISPEDGPRGAHPREHVRPPDLDEYRQWQEAADGKVAIVTLSPEYAGAAEYTRALVSDGVVVSIGHTAANGDQIRAVVDAGARWSTHLGNGAHAMVPRHPNYIWEQLAEDRLSAGFIFDGHHLPPSVMRSVVRAKGIERTILVTDVVAAAGLAPGRHATAIGGEVDLLPTGRLVLAGTPYLAGSVASLPLCVSNAVRHAGVTIGEAVRMVTANPARLLGRRVQDGHESVRVGVTANLTVFSGTEGDVAPVATIVSGRLVAGTI